MKKIILACVLLLSVIFLVACDNDSAPIEVNYTITFNVDGGSSIASTDKQKDQAIGTLPSPTKDGFIFDGWYSDAAKTVNVTSSTVVTGNLTLYAKWIPIEPVIAQYTLTFDTDGGNSVPNETRTEGESITPLPVPTKTGFVFDGWFLDSERNQRVTSSLTVTSDLTLYAKWNAVVVNYTMLFHSLDSTQVDSITGPSGTVVQKPQDPVKEGFTFVAWTFDSEGLEAVTWPYTMNGNVTVYAQWNESVPIGGYLSSLLSNYSASIDDVLPEKLQASGKLYNQTSFVSDYASFVSTTNITYGGYGEQWQMVLENISQAQMFMDYLSVVEVIATTSVVAFNNYLDSNPGSTASFEFTQGLYNVIIDYRNGILSYVIEFSANIILVGEQTVQIALIYDVETGDRSGRIQLGSLGALRYTLASNGFVIASDYLGVRTSYIEVKEHNDGTITGDIFEFITVAGVSMISAAQFIIDDTYATVVGNKASGEIAFEGTIVELYEASTGKLLTYKVRESRLGLTFHTLWFNLDHTTGISSVRGVPKSGSYSGNPHDVYVNNNINVFKTRNVSIINPSRRFDIEFRKQYFYKEVEGQLQFVEVQVPMLFVQAVYVATIDTEVKGQNSYLTNFSLTINASVVQKLETNYTAFLPIFDDNKDNFTAELITLFVGSAYVFENEMV